MNLITAAFSSAAGGDVGAIGEDDGVGLVPGRLLAPAGRPPGGGIQAEFVLAGGRSSVTQGGAPRMTRRSRKFASAEGRIG